MSSIEEVECIETLKKKLDESEDFEYRRMVRAKIRKLKKEQGVDEKTANDKPIVAYSYLNQYSNTKNRKNDEIRNPENIAKKLKTMESINCNEDAGNSNKNTTSDNKTISLSDNNDETENNDKTNKIENDKPEINSHGFDKLKNGDEFKKLPLDLKTVETSDQFLNNKNNNNNKPGLANNYNNIKDSTNNGKNKLIEINKKISYNKSNSYSNNTCNNKNKDTKTEEPLFKKVELKKVPQNQPKTEVINRAKRTQNMSPMQALKMFKSIEKENAGSPGVASEPMENLLKQDTVKDKMLRWCKSRLGGYENINIKDFSSSWNDGLAFCALANSFFPDEFDYDALTPADKKHNFQLAFKTLEDKADIPQLLEVDDMIVTSHPDWKCVFTYVNSVVARMQEIKKEEEEMNG